MSLAPVDAPDLHGQRFPSRRSAVLGTRGMVATSQPLAAQAGLAALHAGGNAVDAAVTAAAALSVVEPTGCGLGGDCFALIYHATTGGVSAFDGSGASPRALTREEWLAAGDGAVPRRGAPSVTVPGAVEAWHRLLSAFGSRSLSDALEPAVRLAEDGYPVSELVASAWQRSEGLLSGHDGARRHWLLEGRAPRAGERFRAPALAETMRTIAEDGARALYEGPIAEDIVATCRKAGGALSAEDLATHRGRWVAPIFVDFGALRVWQCPPPGQGLATLLALGIIDAMPRQEAASFGTTGHLHTVVEALRLAFADAEAHVADPDHAPAPLDQLLDRAYLAERAGMIRGDRALAVPTTGIPGPGGTVYVASVDEDGNGCSLIFSNYMGFGSGIVAERSAVPLQNRGAGFHASASHPNAYAPGKRPFHTIIPGLSTRRDGGDLHAVFGVMGGHMQPQGQLQLMMNLDHFGMDPQRALDAPRIQITPQGSLALEPALGQRAIEELRALGHDVVSATMVPKAGSFGGGQLIAVDAHGVRIGGSDPRKDGLIAAQ